MKGKTEVKEKVIGHIRMLMDARQWTVYHLAKEADVPISTINNMFQRGSCPSVPLMGKISAAFGMTLSDFFADLDGKSAEKRAPKGRTGDAGGGEERLSESCLSKEENGIITRYRRLSASDRKLFNIYLSGLSKQQLR